MNVISYPKPGKDHVKLSPYKYKKLQLQVFTRDGWLCIDCNSPYNLTLSHKIHKGMGGGKGPGDTSDNCVCRCMSCHDKEERHLDGRVKK